MLLWLRYPALYAAAVFANFKFNAQMWAEARLNEHADACRGTEPCECPVSEAGAVD